MVSIAGGVTIFSEMGTQYPEVSTEEIISRNPEYVIVTSYFTEQDGQTKIDAMKTSPDFSNVAAVSKGNFLTLSGLEVWPGLQALDGLEQIAKALHPKAFE